MGSGASNPHYESHGDNNENSVCVKRTIHHKSDNEEHCIRINTRHREKPMGLAQKVFHNIPANFPIKPHVTDDITIICTNSWNDIINYVEYDNVTKKEITGKELFHKEFHKFLTDMDYNNVFAQVFENSSMGNSIKGTSYMSTKLIEFGLSVKNNADSKMRLMELGVMHKQKQIAPWQYSVYITTLIQTIAHRLEKHENLEEIMNAWVTLFAFMLQHALPTAILHNASPNNIYNKANLNTEIKHVYLHMGTDEGNEL